MNKFKIGDKVRVINNDQRYSEDFTGQESEVIESGPNWYEIKVQYKDGDYNFLTFNENELELVDNAPRSFKVGDRVRFDCPDLEVDYGTIVGRYAENSWWIDWESDGDRCHCEEKYLTVVDVEQPEEASSKTKSDGGSSDYYKLEINGNSIEVEDVIYAMVGGDFALGNALKALRRMYLDSKGQGKEGIDMRYDANKIKYFVDSFVERFGGE
jgi:hypothetical protein